MKYVHAAVILLLAVIFVAAPVYALDLSKALNSFFGLEAKITGMSTGDVKTYTIIDRPLYGSMPICSDTTSIDKFCKDNGYDGGELGNAYSGGTCAKWTETWSYGSSMLYSAKCYDLTNQVSDSCVSGQKVGDVNNDGLVNSIDASIVLDIAVGSKPTPSNICCADVDKNGAISSYDASLILGGNVAGVCGSPTDTTPPTVSLSISPAAPTASQQVTFTATAIDASGIKEVSFYVDGALKSTDAVLPYSYTGGPYPTGTHSYYAIATDNSDNKQSTTGQFSVTPDISKTPTIPYFSASPTIVPYNGVSTLSWSSTDATSCIASDGVNSGTKATSGSMSTDNLIKTTTFTLTCTGAGGTSARSSVTVTVGTPDTTPPTVSLSISPAAPTASQQVTFTATAIDASGIKEVSFYVDGALKSTDAVLPYSYTGGPYPTGTHSYYAIATDNSDNKQSTTGQFSVAYTSTVTHAYWSISSAPGSVATASQDAGKSAYAQIRGTNLYEAFHEKSLFIYKVGGVTPASRTFTCAQDGTTCYAQYDIPSTLTGQLYFSALDKTSYNLGVTAPGTPDTTCTDSDSGKNYYTKGTVSGYINGVYYSYSDSCSQPGDVNPLNEYACTSDNSYTAVSYECPNGCSDGACIAQPTSALPNLIVSNFTYEVKDNELGYGAMNIIATIKNIGTSDTVGQFFVTEKTSGGYGYGNNGFTSSSIVYDYAENMILKIGETRKVTIGSYLFPKDTDIKLTVNITADRDVYDNYDNQITESNENDNSLIKTIYFRLNSSTCTDSDGGKNYNTKGTVRISTGPNAGINYSDICLDSSTLLEEYCTNDFVTAPSAERYTCPSGCRDGACNTDRSHNIYLGGTGIMYNNTDVDLTVTAVGNSGTGNYSENSTLRFFMNSMENTDCRVPVYLTPNNYIIIKQIMCFWSA